MLITGLTPLKDVAESHDASLRPPPLWSWTILVIVVAAAVAVAVAVVIVVDAVLFSLSLHL